ncbi:hypothetical protein BGZ72_000399 [Mortierella alpina]|nr:hypothetical protein BGZ72_000399 [Mortierella alpina]
MSSFRNSSLHETSGMSGSRVHCVRVRRLLGRKHQLHRRENRSSSVYESSTTASEEDLYHHAKQSDSAWTLSLSSSRSELQDSHNTTRTISGQRRHNLARDRRLGPLQTSEHYMDGLCTMLSGGGASPFALGYSTNHSQLQDGPLLLPLPPAVERIDMVGSPFSPFTPCEAYQGMEPLPRQRYMRSGQPFGNARAHSSGGGGSGGGGGSDGSGVAGGDPQPGGGDTADGAEPSEYTFRRRNAIVEGSDDAPKSDDFPNTSPK